MVESGTIESVVGTLSKAGPVGFTALVSLVLLLALVIAFRTRSTHTIFRWLWRHISGKAKGSDTAFNDFMDAQERLHQFRFISGRARTVAQMHSLIRWCGLHNEDIADINACGPYFDRERPGLIPPVERPTRENISWTKMALLGLSILMFASGILAAMPGALIILKESGKWVIVDTQSTRSLRDPGKVRLSREQCASPSNKAVADGGFGARDAAIICGFYADPGLPKYVDNTVLEQRWSFGPVAALLLFFCFTTNRRVRRGQAALDMAARLDRPRP